MPASGTRIELLDYVSGSSNVYDQGTSRDNVEILPDTSGSLKGVFKLVISSSLGVTFGNDDNKPGLKIYTASLDPDSPYYYANQLIIYSYHYSLILI